MVDPQNPDYQNTPVSPSRPQYGYRSADLSAAPAVSIVTPFYNTGEVFSETAQSVLQQSLQQWEWIIVNDGSHEPVSLRILDEYRQSDPRVRVIDHPENRGLPAARNTGYRAARSDYILYLDSDDLLEPTAAEKWLWFLESYPRYAFAGGYSTGFGALEYLWQSGFQDMAANLEKNRINHVVMIRKAVLEAVGGYDESLREGLEDWDFWVRCAAQGYWGESVREYLHWYRTSQAPVERWKDMQEERLERIREGLRQRYPSLWEGGFPHFEPYVDLQWVQMNEAPPCANRLAKEKPRLLILAPWLVVGGAEKFNLEVMRQLLGRGWQVSVATTAASDNPWQHEFEQLTPDVFPMANFLEWSDYPRFLSYLIESRQFDAVLLSGSLEGYRLLPFLRQRFPDVALLDFCHFVTPDWMDGGFPRLSVAFRQALDLQLVNSQQLKGWMVGEGVQAERVQVCTTNVDTRRWRPDPELRQRLRQELGVSEAQAVILYIGRIEKQKQPGVFAHTMQRLAAQGLDYLALVIGDGALKGWLEEFVSQNGLEERVRFMGALPNERVRELMTAGEIVFLPSENEGISGVFYEGMACGLAALGADVGGQRELVTPECGALLPRGTEEEEISRYAATLAEWLGDLPKTRQMGRASRERVERYFTLDQMGARMEELLSEAVRLRREQPRQPTTDALTGLLTRQSVEYLRAMGEVRRLDGYAQERGEAYDRLWVDYARLVENPPMPPAPARTYLYFAVRQALFPLLGSADEGWLGKVKKWMKGLLVRGE